MNDSEADELSAGADPRVRPGLGTEGLHNDPCFVVFWLELDDTAKQYKKELRGEI